MSRAGVTGLAILAASAVSFEARADDKDLSLDLGGATLEARLVPHGAFTQGSAATEIGHEKDEEPTRQVMITRDLWFGKYPVTRGQFARFVADSRYVTEAERGQSGGAGWETKGLVQKKEFNWKNPGFAQTDEHPVVLVTFGDASAFVGWLSRKTGKRARLPTEAEWEHAARGGTTTPWYGGSAEADGQAGGWFKIVGTRPVGQKKPNPFGLHDMSGNVNEWCRDVYAPYRDSATSDPEATTNGSTEPERRVLRGGSWLKDVKRGRSAARFRNAAGSRNADNGFRVVITNDEGLAPGLMGTPGEVLPTPPVGLGGDASAARAPGPTLDSSPPAEGGFSWGLLLGSPVAAAAAVVAWMLLRNKRGDGRPAAPAPALPAQRTSRAQPPPSPAVPAGQGLETRLADDGFFVRAPLLPPGSRVRYECIVNGTQVSDLVPLDGRDETFVYTGARPSAVRILEVVRTSGAGYRAAEPAGATAPTGTARSTPPPVPTTGRRSGASTPPPVPTRASTAPPRMVPVPSTAIRRGDSSPDVVPFPFDSPSTANILAVGQTQPLRDERDEVGEELAPEEILEPVSELPNETQRMVPPGGGPAPTEEQASETERILPPGVSGPASRPASSQASQTADAPGEAQMETLIGGSAMGSDASSDASSSSSSSSSESEPFLGNPSAY